MEKSGPVLVAIVLFIVMGAITIVAIKKYQFDQVLKIWNAQIGVFGVLIGMMGTYFYAASSMKIIDVQRMQAVAERNEALAEIEVTESKWMEAAAEINSLSQKVTDYKTLMTAYKGTPLPDVNESDGSFLDSERQ